LDTQGQGFNEIENKMKKILTLITAVIFYCTGIVNINSQSSWSALGLGTNDWINTIAVSGTDIYVGGYFTEAGGSPVNYVAKWDGTSWSSLGSGVNQFQYGVVNSIAVSGNNVYVGGFFSEAGGIPVSNIAKWDGTSWSALGNGLDDYVLALTISGNDVYAGGYFHYIAKWDGTTWSSLGGISDGAAYSLAVSGSNIYAGGEFTSIGGISANKIAKWNGTSWSALGSGVNKIVYTIATSGDDVYAGGRFTIAGGVTVNGLGKWNGTNWSALGNGFGFNSYSGGVFNIVSSGNNIYAGGMFTVAEGSPADYLAKWDGANWSSLGSGVDLDIYAIGVSGNDLYVGGGLTMAGDIPANYIAKYGPNCSLTVSAGQDTSLYLGYGNQNINLTALPSGGSGSYDYLWTPGNFTTQSITVSPTTSTSYIVNVTNQGCSATDTVLVTVYDTRCGNNGNKVLVCHNGITICISPEAVQAHLNHGDLLGSCDLTPDNQTGMPLINIPQNYMLHANYPNPFNPETNIKYDLPFESSVTLVIYDITGREVSVLIDESKQAGYHSVTFEASHLASGVYFYRLEAKENASGKIFTSVKKMLLIK